MKRLIALTFSLVMMLSLCACNGGSGQKSNGEEHKFESTEDELAYNLISAAISELTNRSVIGCSPCIMYKNVEGDSLVMIILYGEKIGETVFGLFDGTELRELLWAYDAENTVENFEAVNSAEFTVSKDVCDALGIATYQELCESDANDIVCDYLKYFVNNLERPYAVEINSVYCYVERDEVVDYKYGFSDLYYYFTVNFTITNDFGGKYAYTMGNSTGISRNDRDVYGEGFLGYYEYEYIEDETYAKDQENSFMLNSELIQSCIY